MIGSKNMERAMKLFTAARLGTEELSTVQEALAREIVGDDVIAKDEECRCSRPYGWRDMTDFEATTELTKALAFQLNDDSNRYDLRSCNESTFRELWALRQIIDKTGIPYPIYVGEALQWLQQNDKKRIRPKMLMSSKVLLHVMECYDAEVLAWHRANAETDAVSVNDDDAGPTEE